MSMVAENMKMIAECSKKLIELCEKLGMVEEKKTKYPKTFIEVLNFWFPDRQLEDGYQRGYKKYLIEKFQDLLYARDAYWQIAGEEMGLDEPWEPDWTNLECSKFCIWLDVGDITLRDVLRCQHILAFPTAEMRDAFYENFKELIESVKELL